MFVFPTVPKANAEAEPSFSVAPQSNEYFYEDGGYIPLTLSFKNNSSSESLKLLSVYVSAIDGEEISTDYSWKINATVSRNQCISHVRSMQFNKSMFGKPITFTAEYSFSYSSTVYTKNFSLTLYSTEANIETEVSVSNRTPVVGETVTVTYKIKNPNPVSATVQIYDAAVIKDNLGRPVYYDFGTVASGETKTVTRSFVFDKQVAIQPQVIFSCHMAGRDVQKTITYDFSTVNEAAPSLSVSLEPSDNEVIAGSQVYMTVTVTNIGNVAVHSITVSLSSSKTTLTSIDLVPGSSYSKKVPVTVTDTTDFTANAIGIFSGNQTVNAQSSPVTVSVSEQEEIFVSMTAEAYTYSLQIGGNVSIRFTLSNLSGLSCTNVRIIEKTRGVIGTINELDVGTYNYEFIVSVAQTETLEFHIEMTDPTGKSFIGKNCYLSITVGGQNPLPIEPTPTPVPTSGVDIANIPINQIWNKLLSTLQIFMIIAASAVVIYLIYFVYSFITASSGKRDKKDKPFSRRITKL